MGRAPCCDKNGLKKGPWTTEEDAMLVNYIQMHGPGNWRNLPKNAGLQRCGKSCSFRWTNYLRPDMKGGRFSFEEEETIIQLLSILGNKWSAIAACLPGRTDNEIKNYWNTRIRKRLIRMGIDPATHQQQPLVNPELLRLATSLLSIKQENPELCFEGGQLIMLTVLYEVEPEKYIDWTGLAVFPARKDCALASFKTKFSATRFVDELDESEKSVAHTASLHIALCVDLFLKKHERTDGASVLFGLSLEFFQDNQCVTHAKRFVEASKIFLLSCNFQTPDSASTLLGGELRARPFVEELEPEKSAVCVAVFLSRTDCTLALLGGELGATPLEEFEELKKTALQTQIEIVLPNDRTDRMAVIWAPHDWAVDGLVPLAVSCKNNSGLLVHYNAKIIDLTISQDKRFMWLKKTNVTNSAKQHKCLARSQGHEIFSSSCNALSIVTEDDAVTKSSRFLWLPIKHGARVSQKDKLGLTFFFAILLPGWIPVVNAVEENAFIRVLLEYAHGFGLSSLLLHQPTAPTKSYVGFRQSPICLVRR